MTFAYIFAVIGGIPVWILAARLYLSARRIGSLRWSVNVLLGLSMSILAIGVLFGVASNGLAGAAVAFGITGIVALLTSVGTWWQARVAQGAAKRLDELFATDTDLAHRFEQHPILRHITRKRS
jgi:cation transport ATPase